MCSENVDFLIVYRKRKYPGVITDQDIAAKILYEERPLNKIVVKDFVNTTLPVITSADNIGQCMQLMERYHAKHVAVFDNDNLVFKGVLAIGLIHKGYSKPNLNFEEADSVKPGYPWTY